MPAGSIFCNNCGARVTVNPPAPAKFVASAGFVNLGLPSGTLWAACNVGAIKPEDYGNYYDFEEARRLKVPTKEQFAELLNKCTVTWTTHNGVNGRLFTGPNGNLIFLPAAGCRYGSSLGMVGYGCYWSSSLRTYGPDGAWSLYFYSDNCSVGYYPRCVGFTVRPVCVSAQN